MIDHLLYYKKREWAVESRQVSAIKHEYLEGKEGRKEGRSDSLPQKCDQYMYINI